jgi:hypothetical protein
MSRRSQNRAYKELFGPGHDIAIPDEAPASTRRRVERASEGIDSEVSFAFPGKEAAASDFLGQVMADMMADEGLRSSAMANSLERFSIGMEDKIARIMMERMERNAAVARHVNDNIGTVAAAVQQRIKGA